MYASHVNEMQLAPEYTAEDREGVLMDAGDLASDHDQVTFITGPDGKRLFAVVPVEFAEHTLEREAL